MHRELCGAVAGLLALILATNAAQADGPLYAKNLSPVSGLFGLPSQRVAATRSPDTYGLALHTSIASHYILDTGASEGVSLDGETLRFAFEARYGLARNWDIQLEVPWLEHSGGHLDSLIDSWHSLWGMSDGGRSDVPHNLLDYRYGGPDTSFALLDDTSGLGDITVSVSHAFYRDAGSAAALALGYKFATGDEDEFLGSGGDDVFVALRFSGEHLGDLPLNWHGQAGYLRAGKSGILAAAQERDLWFLGLALDWAVADTVSLIAQVDMNRAPTNSDLTALGDDAVQLALGLRWGFARCWNVDFSFTEDVRVETAPDFGLQASLRYYPDR
jgi:hypothetical protein